MLYLRHLLVLILLINIGFSLIPNVIKVPNNVQQLTFKNDYMDGKVNITFMGYGQEIYFENITGSGYFVIEGNGRVIFKDSVLYEKGGNFTTYLGYGLYKEGPFSVVFNNTTVYDASFYLLNNTSIYVFNSHFYLGKTYGNKDLYNFYVENSTVEERGVSHFMSTFMANNSYLKNLSFRIVDVFNVRNSKLENVMAFGKYINMSNSNVVDSRFSFSNAYIHSNNITQNVSKTLSNFFFNLTFYNNTLFGYGVASYVGLVPRSSAFAEVLENAFIYDNDIYLVNATAFSLGREGRIVGFKRVVNNSFMGNKESIGVSLQNFNGSIEFNNFTDLKYGILSHMFVIRCTFGNPKVCYTTNSYGLIANNSFLNNSVSILMLEPFYGSIEDNKFYGGIGVVLYNPYNVSVGYNRFLLNDIAVMFGNKDIKGKVVLYNNSIYNSTRAFGPIVFDENLSKLRAEFLNNDIRNSSYVLELIFLPTTITTKSFSPMEREILNYLSTLTFNRNFVWGGMPPTTSEKEGFYFKGDVLYMPSILSVADKNNYSINLTFENVTIYNDYGGITFTGKEVRNRKVLDLIMSALDDGTLYIGEGVISIDTSVEKYLRGQPAILYFKVDSCSKKYKLWYANNFLRDKSSVISNGQFMGYVPSCYYNPMFGYNVVSFTTTLN